MSNTTATVSSPAVVLTPQELLEHWQGHRRLTRRVIEAFPEDKLFNYSIGGMRPFSELVEEFLGMGIPGVKGVATGKWERFGAHEGTTGWDKKATTKKELLERWDHTTEEISRIWNTIPIERFHEFDTAFGMYQGVGNYFIFYFIDNEIHHRGQGYVYLRSLGIEPPAFYERS